jgi:excisionase family DNA binding protein
MIVNKDTGKGSMLKGIKRVAAYYKCSVRTVQELVNKGVIPSYKLGRNRYFYSNEIDDALRDKSKGKEATLTKEIASNSQIINE